MKDFLEVGKKIEIVAKFSRYGRTKLSCPVGMVASFPSRTLCFEAPRLKEDGRSVGRTHMWVRETEVVSIDRPLKEGERVYLTAVPYRYFGGGRKITSVKVSLGNVTISHK